MYLAFLHVMRWLVILNILFFVSGCAVPPAKSDKNTTSQVETKKKQKKKKVTVKKSVKKKAPEVVESVDAGAVVKREADTQPEPELILGRTMFHYDYYPDKEVYFDTIRHLYFYRDGGGWAMSVALPASFQENLGSSVRLKLDISRPYLMHQEHREEYPSGMGGRDF